jgi:hypothetical protein
MGKIWTNLYVNANGIYSKNRELQTYRVCFYSEIIKFLPVAELLLLLWTFPHESFIKHVDNCKENKGFAVDLRY